MQTWGQGEGGGNHPAEIMCEDVTAIEGGIDDMEVDMEEVSRAADERFYWQDHQLSFWMKYLILTGCYIFRIFEQA